MKVPVLIMISLSVNWPIKFPTWLCDNQSGKLERVQIDGIQLKAKQRLRVSCESSYPLNTYMRATITATVYTRATNTRSISI